MKTYAFLRRRGEKIGRLRGCGNESLTTEKKIRSALAAD
jgi:hypothetical protein